MSGSVIDRSPDVMGGTPVFAGTRVPVETLIDYLETGETIDGFLDDSRSLRWAVTSFWKCSRSRRGR